MQQKYNTGGGGGGVGLGCISIFGRMNSLSGNIAVCGVFSSIYIGLCCRPAAQLVVELHHMERSTGQ